jgi:Family of unknown function (DUF5670)
LGRSSRGNVSSAELALFWATNVARQNSRIIAIAGTPGGRTPNSAVVYNAGLARLKGALLARLPCRRVEMLYTLAVILLIAWLLGIVGTYTIGAFVHVLLVVAIVLFLVGLLSGRTTVV